MRSRDGTTIACFVTGDRAVRGGPPLVLVHGTAADHTTFRVVEPLLRGSFTCWSVDRRGRGGSGDAAGGASGEVPGEDLGGVAGDGAADGRSAYSIVREFEDVASVAEAAATADERAGGRGAVAVVGHSYGGRCALGAALLTERIERVVAYEGAPGESPLGDVMLADRLSELVRAGRGADALRLFLREVVGMTDGELTAYEAAPVWPARVAAAGTIPRELAAAERDPAASLEALAAVRRPVLLLAGGASRKPFLDATAALASRLPEARVSILPGQKHAAHHTDPERFVAEVRAFVLAAG